jgi:hypothetical protein
MVVLSNKGNANQSYIVILTLLRMIIIKKTNKGVLSRKGNAYIQLVEIEVH